MKSSEWNIHYSKFFTFPNTISSSPPTSLLRPISSGRKRRLQGTWEEHYVSKLNFLRPKGYGLDESSVKGCRVIFACYRDIMGQVQKFAMRFSSSQECQKFMEMLKCLKDGNEATFSSVMLSSVFSEGEHIHTRQAVNHEHALVAYRGSQQEAFGCDPESSNMAFPENCTALLANCFTSNDPDAFQAPAEIDLKLFLGAGSKADKPFIDLLEKMDNIIVGLVGDLKFVGAEA
ncbi:hypothetical protein RND81_02G020300 [Saponaria officinalis]|uniref:Poor homologous synapsis 1 PH domain-containing protein n=1 Tax=Saponaria officinalis TaxID=3572 RepID=A0AAW1MML5_SAPOF